MDELQQDPRERYLMLMYGILIRHQRNNIENQEARIRLARQIKAEWMEMVRQRIDEERRRLVDQVERALARHPIPFN
jgi:hypothetical protein